MAAPIASGQRWSKQHPCPICGGHQATPPGRGERCWGYASDDGAVAFCTRSEFSGPLQPLVNAGGAYAHRLAGDCTCGRVHGSGPRPAAPPRRVKAVTGPPLEPDVLDAVYWRYLALSPLRPEHREFFDARGDLKAALDYRYGSLPFGAPAARSLTERLAAEFGAGPIERAPGFWVNRYGLVTHTGTAKDDAAVIPYWSSDAQIVGMVRRTITGDKPKYRVFVKGGAPCFTPGEALISLIRQRIKS